MTAYLTIAISAFLASLISFFSGFGLGTILMPVMAIFFPLPIAISFTAIIHLLQNSLKTYLLWRVIDWNVALKFGLTALIASIPGALLLKELSVFGSAKEYVFLGIKGAVSGFFGGLSGNQGALRSVFLINTNLDKNAFIGTNAMISMMVDIARLVVYSLSFSHLLASANLSLCGIAIAAAGGGVLLGMTLLKKVTIEFIQKLIIVLLFLLGTLLILGII